MDKDRGCETDAELPSVQRPVDADEGEEAEEKFQLEDGEEEPFAFEEDEHEGAERPEPLEPGGCRVSGLRHCGKMVAHPLGLCGVGGQEVEGLGPELACTRDIAGRFALLRLGGEGVDLLCVDESMAARAGARASGETGAPQEAQLAGPRSSGAAEERSNMRDGRAKTDFL